jgi:hypothetical protein
MIIERQPQLLFHRMTHCDCFTSLLDGTSVTLLKKCSEKFSASAFDSRTLQQRRSCSCYSTKEAYTDPFIVLFLSIEEFDSELGLVKLKRILLDYGCLVIKARNELLAGDFKRHNHVKFSGCRFHYSKAIVRTVYRIRLKAAKEIVKPFRQWLQRVLGLSLLPENLMRSI